MKILAKNKISCFPYTNKKLKIKIRRKFEINVVQILQKYAQQLEFKLLTFSHSWKRTHNLIFCCFIFIKQYASTSVCAKITNFRIDAARFCLFPRFVHYNHIGCHHGLQSEHASTINWWTNFEYLSRGRGGGGGW